MLKNKRRRIVKNSVYINVAPLVDVMMVLMMIFMITSQAQISGIKIDLPKAAAEGIDVGDAPIVITVDKNAKMYIADTEISMKALLEKLPLIVHGEKDRVVYVSGDKNLQYGTLVSIMGVLANAGICRISLVVENKGQQ
jgi:biopolymer transport protein TolR